MNILFELKERLHQSAMAGTDLLNEDFRLKKIAEQIKPLSAKNPVFKKISERLEELFNADNNDRPTKLINAISLVDAVVVTQSTYKKDGAISEIPQNNSIFVYNEISYNHLKPIIDMFKNRNFNKINIFMKYLYYSIKEDYEKSEEFKIIIDFRMKKYLISAIGKEKDFYSMFSRNIINFTNDKKLISDLKNNFSNNKNISYYIKKQILKKRIISIIFKEFDISSYKNF